MGRLIWASAWTAPVVVLLLAGGMQGLGDRWWPATLLLFGPRWLLLVPLLALGLAALKRRRLWVPLALTTMLLLGPVLGFRIGWKSWLVGGDRADDLRLITFNAADGEDLGPQEAAALTLLDPDIVAFQECPDLARLFAPDSGWFIHDSRGSLCLASRFPIDSVAQQDRQVVQRAGGSGWVIRYQIAAPDGVLQLTNVHLDTPRPGLEYLLSGQLAEGIGQMASDATLRDIESRRARRWADDAQGRMLVLGDFNMPTESIIYDRHWSGLTNAFSAAGFGFGSTRFNGWIRVRIDHILLGPGWRVVRAFVGPDLGSDHRPLIADVRWQD